MVWHRELEAVMDLRFSRGNGARGMLPPVHVCSTEAEFVAVLVFVGLVFFPLCCVSHDLFQKVT